MRNKTKPVFKFLYEAVLEDNGSFGVDMDQVMSKEIKRSQEHLEGLPRSEETLAPTEPNPEDLMKKSLEVLEQKILQA